MADYGSGAGAIYAHGGQVMAENLRHGFADLATRAAAAKKEQDQAQAVMALYDMASRFQMPDAKTGKMVNVFRDDHLAAVKRMIDQKQWKAAGALEASMGIGKDMINRYSTAYAKQAAAVEKAQQQQQFMQQGPVTTTVPNRGNYRWTGTEWVPDTAVPRDQMGLSAEEQLNLQKGVNKDANQAQRLQFKAQQAAKASQTKIFSAFLKSNGIASPTDLFDTSIQQGGTFTPETGFTQTDPAQGQQTHIRLYHKPPEMDAAGKPILNAQGNPVGGKLGVILPTSQVIDMQNAAAQMAGPAAVDALQWLRQNPDNKHAAAVAAEISKRMGTVDEAPEPSTFVPVPPREAPAQPPAAAFPQGAQPVTGGSDDESQVSDEAAAQNPGVLSVADLYQVIDDPNDPRLANTPLNEPQDNTGFDPEAFITGSDKVQKEEPQALPTLTPHRSTFYYPSTPEDQIANGLDPKMEGGPYGAGKFSNLALQPHSLEAYRAGTSDFVAVAMKGDPTGNLYNAVAPDGLPAVIKHVDTGGGLKEGQVDWSTSVPQLAKTGGSGFDPQSFIKGKDLKVPDVSAFLEPAPADTPEAEQAAQESPTEAFGKALSRGVQGAAEAIGRLGTPKEIKLAQLQSPKMEIPQTPSLQGNVIPSQGMIGQAIPTPQVPQGGAPQYAPTPIPGLDPQAIQQATQMAQGIPQQPIAQPQPLPTSGAPIDTPLMPIRPVSEAVREGGVGQGVQQFIDNVKHMAYQTKGELGDMLNAPVKLAQTATDPNVSVPKRLAAAAGVVASAAQLDPLIPHAGISKTAGITSTREVPVPESLQPQAPSAQAPIVQPAQQQGLPFKPASVQGLKNPAHQQAIAQMKSDVADLKYKGKHAEAKALQGQINQLEGLTAPPAQPPAGAPPPPPTGGRGGAPLPPQQAPVSPQSLNPTRDGGPFYRTYKVDKELGEHMDAIGASPEYGAIVSEYAYRNLTHELNPQQEADLGKLLVSDRLKKVNPQHPQVIFDSVARGIESDPAIKKALDYYRKEIEPEMEDLHRRAGVSEGAIKANRGNYVPLVPERLPDGSIPMLGVVPRASRMSRTTKFATPAEGLAAKYSTNMKDVLREGFTEATRKAALRDLFETAEAKGVAEPSSQFVPDPAAGPNAGKWVKSVQFEGLHPSLQHDLQLIARHGNTVPPGGLQKFLRAYQRGATGVQLGLNPLEVQSHMRRQLHIVAAKPPVGMGLLARLEAVLPYFGPKIGTFKRAMRDMSTPERQAILKDITRQGGGSTRAFGEKFGIIKKVPGAKQVSEFTNRLLFSVPKGKGVMGWDLRMRVLLEEIRRNAEPSLANDKQRMRQFANQIGQYGSMKSWTVQALSHVNPYAATSAPMRLSEFKTLLGDPNFRPENVSKSTLHRMETFMRGTGGTIAMLVMANKLLSGKYPWENDPKHWFDLNTGVKDKDGNYVYVANRFLSPEFYRAISTMSVPDMVRELRSPKSTALSKVAAASVGPSNAALSLVNSPALGLTAAAVPQMALHLTHDPGKKGLDILKVGQYTNRDRARGIPPLLKRAEGVAEQVHPLLASILGYMDEPINGLKPLGIFSIDTKHGGSGYSSGAPSGRGSGGRSESARGQGGR